MTLPTPAPGLAPLAGVQTPAVCVDRPRMDANLARMASALRERGVAMRPHAKTHKSVAVARAQLAAGAVGITTATLGEAEVMAAGGIPDIFIAYPIWATAEVGDRIRALLGRTRLRVGADSAESLVALAGTLGADTGRVAIMIEVESGEGRTGVHRPADAAPLALAARSLGFPLAGVFTHGGHSYAGPEAAGGAADDEVRVLSEARDALRAKGIEVGTLSAGSTPTATLSARDGVTEERPGTFIFGDRQQVALGAHPAYAVAAFVTATVVSTQLPGHMIIDAGGKILTKDKPVTVEGFGVLPDFPRARIVRLYDHHGVVDLGGHGAPAVGSRVVVVPNHVCPVVNTVDVLHVVTPDGVEEWPVDARGRNG